MTREEWLLMVGEKIWPLILNAGGSRPEKVRVSVGFPRGSRGAKAHAIGECWPTQLSADRTFEIFISPELETLPAVETLAHELVHSAVGLDKKHGPGFRKVAVGIGLTGKMTATYASDEFRKQILGWLDEMPPYPHAALKKPTRGSIGSRLVKASCPECGYTMRVTAKWLNVAIPRCPDVDCKGRKQFMEIGG